ncbi:MAG: hypothetical protein BGO67_03675 [Alphaproteobacteria bacterium 41-28]|nr:MAG: hypothetical protein BGO67_03675 [Alphaproteobacteria bacterium 41-28]
MSKFKYQDLVKVSLIFTGLFLSSELSKAMDFEESNQIGPKKPTRPKHEWENKKPQGQIGRKGYVETHNSMARKYGFSNHTIDHRASNQDPTLEEMSKKFVVASERLKEKEAKSLEEVNTFGKKVVDGVGGVAEIIIEEGVKSPKTQGIFSRLKNEVTNGLKNLFN